LPTEMGECGLVERERELAALERLVQSVRVGAGAALVVEGPPGIGKSSWKRPGSTETGLHGIWGR
jgi:ABC-type transport system involved in cytochrome c biogenesis ATPase subunit